MTESVRGRAAIRLAAQTLVPFLEAAHDTDMRVVLHTARNIREVADDLDLLATAGTKKLAARLRAIAQKWDDSHA